MAHVVERATSGRAKCRGCGSRIAAGEWRFGERLPNPFADDGGEMTHWFHPACAAFRRPEPFLEALATMPEGIDQRERLEREARLGVEHRRLPRVNTAERASSSRATCRSCREPIEKGAWRVSLVYYEEGRFMPSGFVHIRCAPAYFETAEIVDRLRHFSPVLDESGLAEIRTELKAAASG
jgi:ribosomal protein L37AE/L43A